MSWERLRVFIAVDIDDPLLVSSITRVIDSLTTLGVPMKPVEPQNLHITIRFIGEVPRSTVDEIIESVLSKVSFKEFTLRLKGMGAFPSTVRPRVVWIGVEDGFRELRELRDQVETGLRALGLKPERQDFKPHLTLARIKGTRNIASLVKFITEYQDYEFGEMKVKALRLKKSTLTRSGPIYETLWEVKA
ncbi:MAG: RNA 2',3'-cyclic phosphodiesterase [Desulfurococcales archaeon]|nr:RNA 2',3'-cyclic phosphodiesterase [Desulfurococcales archaeon]